MRFQIGTLKQNELQTLRFQSENSKQDIGQVFERSTNMEYKLLEHNKKFDMVFDQLQQEENYLINNGAVTIERGKARWNEER